MKNAYFILLLISLLFLGACRPAIHDRTDDPIETGDVDSSVNTALTPVAPYEGCGWQWATQYLGPLSTQVQLALENAGISVVSVHAQVFGENCLSSENEILYFAPMETDFEISVTVEDLSDTNSLGNLLEAILVVLDSFPPEETPGPQPGLIGIEFINGSEHLWIRLTVAESIAIRSLGLHGSDLLKAAGVP